MGSGTTQLARRSYETKYEIAKIDQLIYGQALNYKY